MRTAEHLKPFGDLGTWSDPYVQDPSRRRFLQLLTMASASLATGFTGQAVFDVLPNMFIDPYLTDTQRNMLLHRIKRPQIRLGYYPDFEKNTRQALDDVSLRAEQLPSMEHVGFFALLEDCKTPALMKKHSERIRRLQKLGLRPLISLGTGSFLRPHPFLPQHTDAIHGMINSWVKFFADHTTGDIDVRLFFEANTYAGDISYRNNGTVPEKEHQRTFREYQEYFAKRLGGLLERIHIHLSLAVSGGNLSLDTGNGNLKEYLPAIQDIRVVGLDVYPEPYGRIATLSLCDYLLGTESSVLKNMILVDLLRVVPEFYGSGTRRVLHEIGAPAHHVSWFEMALYLMLSQGDGAYIFGIDKTKQENMDYRVTEPVLRVLQTTTLDHVA